MAVFLGMLKRLGDDVLTEVVPLPRDLVFDSVATVPNVTVRADFIAPIMNASLRQLWMLQRVM